MKHFKQQRGFTIIELLIATAVFSTVLLLSLTGFLQIGQLFYKGISSTTTQDAARRVADSIKNDIVFDTNVSQVTPTPVGTSGATRWYFCAGTSRYTYMKGKELNTNNEATEMKDQPSSAWVNFGILKDDIGISGGCANPFSTGFNSPNELLGDKMRVGDISITPLAPPNDNLYNIAVIIAYGDDAFLTNPTSPNVRCDSRLANSQYCFVTDLKTTVRRGY